MRLELGKEDAVSWLKKIESGSVDLVITDPPYQSMEQHRRKGTTTRLKHSKSSSNDWFDIFPNERFHELLSEVFRVLKKNSHFYLMCDSQTMFIIKPIAEKAGFKFWKPIVWDKVAIGMGYHFRCRYEFVLFFEKGKRKLNNLSMPDILTHKRVYRNYPTEKPVPLFSDLISQSSQPGEVFLDPFFGSGASLIAAMNHHLRVLGNDISDQAHAHFQSRIEQNNEISQYA